MPFLLLDDAQQTVMDELRRHVQSLQDTASQVSLPPIQPPQIDANVIGELQQHVQSLVQPQAGEPPPPPIQPQPDLQPLSASVGPPEGISGQTESSLARLDAALRAAADVIEQRRQDDLTRQANLGNALLGDTGAMQDVGSNIQSLIEANPGSSQSGDLSSPVSAGLTAARVDPNLSRVLGQVANVAAPMALEGGLARGVSPAARAGAESIADTTQSILRPPGGSLEALGQLRADATRQAAQPPPAPPPGSAERLDWLTGRGRWAPPETPESTSLDKALAVGVNGMLGHPSGMLSNALSGLAENVMRPVTTALVRRELGPAFADVQAQGAALGDALANMASTFLTGKRPSGIGSADYPEAFPGKLGALPFTTGNIRANSAMDEFNRTLAMAGAQAAELARLKAANPGASVQDLVNQNAQRLQDLGIEAAKSATFESGGTGIGETLARARAKLTSPDASDSERLAGLATQLVVPFSKIPDVILRRGVGDTPLIGAEPRLLVGLVRAVRSGDREAATQALTQWGLTEAVNTAIGYQAWNGNITGNGPDDPAKRRTLQNARDRDGNPIWVANSIRVPTPWGQRWVPYTSLGPAAIRMAAIANTVEQVEAQQGQIDPDLLKGVAKGAGETITDAWYLQGVARLFQALQYGSIFDAAGNTLLDFGERYVPDAALTNQVRQLVDPTVREPTNPLEDVANRIPGASLLVPQRVNPATGGGTQAPKDALSLLLRSPAPGQPDLVSAELATHNLGVGDAPATITQNRSTVAITPDEQRFFQQAAGAAIAHDVAGITASASYQRMTPEQQRRVLEQAISKAREYASAQTARQIPREELLRRMDRYAAVQRAQAEPNRALRPVDDAEQARPPAAPITAGPVAAAVASEPSRGPVILPGSGEDQAREQAARANWIASLVQRLGMARANGDAEQAEQLQQVLYDVRTA